MPGSNGTISVITIRIFVYFMDGKVTDVVGKEGMTSGEM